MAYPWLETVQGAAAISVAARRGLFDALLRGETVAMPALLRDLLIGAGVLRRVASSPELTPSFAAIWQSESAAITACADFMIGAARDVAGDLEGMIYDLPEFMQNAHTFQFFRYDKAMGTTPAHLDATRPWVTYLEALARREAAQLVPHIPLSEGERLLEVGGNTGIMSAALATTYKCGSATILDLPAVCVLGRASPWSDGLVFHEGDARAIDAFEPFAGETDVILFKSVLHDWPELDVRDMMLRAIEILPRNGRIIVCERGAYGHQDAAAKDAQTLANIVFAPFYRSPDLYVEIMSAAGLELRQTSQRLDMMFHVTTGVRR